MLQGNYIIFNNHSTTKKLSDYSTIADSNATSDPVDNMFLWLIGPQVLNGVAQLLVNTTALEFICAQSTQTLNGVLIGLWYAMFSITYLIMSLLDIVFQGSRYFVIYQGWLYYFQLPCWFA